MLYLLVFIIMTVACSVHYSFFRPRDYSRDSSPIHSIGICLSGLWCIEGIGQVLYFYHFPAIVKPESNFTHIIVVLKEAIGRVGGKKSHGYQTNTSLCALGKACHMHCTILHYPTGVGEGKLYSPRASHHTWQEQAVLDFNAQLWDTDDQLCHH